MKKRVKTKVAKQCTWVQNHMFTFLSLVNKDLLVKNIVFTTNIIHYSLIHYLWKGTDFEGVILLKFIIFMRNSLYKKLWDRIFTKIIRIWRKKNCSIDWYFSCIGNISPIQRRKEESAFWHFSLSFPFVFFFPLTILFPWPVWFTLIIECLNVFKYISCSVMALLFSDGSFTWAENSSWLFYLTHSF